ncbi:MAG: efflux RND transporter periplasmic adaptor subunit [Acidobacteria bacterium]|nr:efflux RND transporter periplasmic adaptor subunit [Acidobacteriota bacterium]
MSSVGSSRPQVRSPIVYALLGAAACLAIVAIAALVFWPRSGPAVDGSPAALPAGGFGFGSSPVEVVTAVEMIAAEPVELLGSVAPAREAIVASEVEGVVSAVFADEGDRVAEGSVLARLRTTTMELDLAAARASRAEAAARLVRFESEIARLTNLRERGAISEREYEQGIADRDAQAQTVVRFESEAARLEELIVRAEILAPFDGLISAVHVEVGEWTARGGDIATLVDLQRVEVTVAVPERYVSQAEAAREQGITLDVVFDALPGSSYPGLIRAVLPQANPQTRTFPVIVSVNNPDGTIRGGMFARIQAQIGTPVPTVLIPKDALVLRSGRTFVYRVVEPAAAGNGTAPAADPAAGTSSAGMGAPPQMVQEIEVEIGAGYGAWQVIAGGIQGGDVVVVRGNESLRQGAPVVVAGEFSMDPPPTPSAGLPSTERRKSDSR